MIRVQRGPAPPLISENADAWAQELCQKWSRYYHELGQQAAGPKAKPPHADKARYASLAVKRALKQMFGTKCCYCEAKVDAVSYRHVEHFRPQSIFPRLAYKWSNLLFACERCNSTHKGDRFPLGMSGTQSQPNRTSPCALDDKDDGVLIDPCRDDLSEHFEYEFIERPEEDFIDVVLVCKSRRGELSRDVYGLTRVDLVDDWREHILGIQNDIDGYLLALAIGDRRLQRRFGAYLRKAMASTSPYSAMTRSYIEKKRGLNI